MHYFSVALSLLTLLNSFVWAIEFEVGSAVRVPDGSQFGGKVSKWQPSVSDYLGIPFAQPPVGSLRWQPPKKFVGNANTSIPGTNYASSMITPAEFLANLITVTELPSKPCHF